MNRQELESHLHDLFEGIITDENFALLQQELSSNPESRVIYSQFVHVQNILEQRIQGQTLNTSSSVVPIDKILRRQRKRQLWIATASAAAIVILAVITMRLFFVEEKPPTLVFETSPGTQFTITHTQTDSPPEKLTMQKGSRLQISQGTVELTFASGVRSIVMAPADMSLHDENTLFLNQGTAWFQVPKEAIGFTIKTKDLHVVDLGTEFGVLAKPDDHDEVHVFKGKVQVTAQGLRKESSILVANEARKNDPVGRLDTIVASPSSFLTTLPKSLPYLHWSFDSDTGFQVAGTHPDAANISVRKYGSPQFSPGKKGDALSLNGKKQHLITDWSGFAGDRPRTIGFWLKLPTNGNYKDLPGVIGWGNRTHKKGKWKVTLVNKGPNTPTYLRLSWGSIWLTGKTPITPDQWNRITISSNGQLDDNDRPQAQFYINGRHVVTHHGKQGKHDPVNPNTITDTHGSVPLTIGSDLWPEIANKAFFHGEIDELYIFDGYLTDKEVQSMISQ